MLAIGFTAFASFLSFKSILIGAGITRPILVLWIIAGVLWSIIGFRALWNFILNDRMAQGVILGLIILYLLFAPPKQKKVTKKKNGNKK